MMTTFTVSGMNCGHCTKAITQAILEIDAQAHVETDLVSKTVKVNSSRNADEIRHVIIEAGYEVVGVV